MQKDNTTFREVPILPFIALACYFSLAQNGACFKTLSNTLTEFQNNMTNFRMPINKYQ
jgi:hypothetical protein